MLIQCTILSQVFLQNEINLQLCALTINMDRSFYCAQIVLSTVCFTYSGQHQSIHFQMTQYHRNLKRPNYYNIAPHLAYMFSYQLQSDLDNKTWSEVQSRLMEVQEELQMCIHKNELSHLGM